MQEKEREKKREKENTKRANGSKTRVKLKRREANLAAGKADAC